MSIEREYEFDMGALSGPVEAKEGWFESGAENRPTQADRVSKYPHDPARPGYDAFYNRRFTHLRGLCINVCEVGRYSSEAIQSLPHPEWLSAQATHVIRKWDRFFPCTNIHYIDIDTDVRATLETWMGVGNLNGRLYDLICLADTPRIEDQVRFVSDCIQFVHPGAVMVIEGVGEDRFPSVAEAFRTDPWVAANISLVERISIKHVHNRAPGHLVILHRARRMPQTSLTPVEFADMVRTFPTPQILRPSWATRPLLRQDRPQARIVLITPSCRPHNLAAIRAQLAPRAAHIAAWVVVHDASDVPGENEGGAGEGVTNPSAASEGEADSAGENGGESAASVASPPAPPPLREIHMAHKNPHSIAGNAQRNAALQLVDTSGEFDDDWIYFLDDDNYVHPALWDLPLEPGARGMYSFDLFDAFSVHGDFKHAPLRVNRGIHPRQRHIDTAQAIFSVRAWREAGKPTWQLRNYSADGVFIQYLAERMGQDLHYVSEIMAMYNALRQ